jgi:hypothetical protein
VIAGHPVDIARSVSIDAGICCAHEWHNYTFAPVSVAFPLLGGTLTIKDPGHYYELIFAAGTRGPHLRTFPAEPATLLLAIEQSSAVPVPTLLPIGLWTLGVLVAVLGISAVRKGCRGLPKSLLRAKS